jgi:hypothetical protein
LMLTRPASIQLSASRREQMPVSLMNLLRRICKKRWRLEARDES